MADKHIFNDHTTLINRSLKGVVASNPTLRLIPSLRVVFNPKHPKDEVSIICGGGGGHEPASSGFVGDGLLAASVSGDIFGSPSARQVLGGIRSVPSDAGTILVVTNYTGDCLHFGLATQQARALGVKNIEMIMITDDVAIPRSAGALVGRRALGGTTLVCKILGAASRLPAGSRPNFQQLVAVGKAARDGLASIGASLGHSHVPGRTEHFKPSVDTVELGVGVHNEPGYFVISPKPSAEDLVDRMMDLILDEADVERAFVNFDKTDEIVLYVNNMGAMAPLEINAFVDQVLTRLERDGLKRPLRIYSGAFVTTIAAPGVSVTLMNVTQAAAQASQEYPMSVDDMLDLLDAPHSSLSWVSAVKWTNKVKSTDELLVELPKASMEFSEEGEIKVDAKVLQAALSTASRTLSAAEPDLTKWDTIVGDGDCGETCDGGAQAVLKAVGQGLGATGDLLSTFNTLTHVIDDSCGGTLGALVSIFLAGLTAEIRNAPKPPQVDGRFWGEIAAKALATLRLSTKASVGHRTMMDALIPFVETLQKTGRLSEAVEAAHQGGLSTIPMTAKLGRATYVGKGQGGALPPDPGAMAVYYVAKGLSDALS